MTIISKWQIICQLLIRLSLIQSEWQRSETCAVVGVCILGRLDAGCLFVCVFRRHVSRWSLLFPSGMRCNYLLLLCVTVNSGFTHRWVCVHNVCYTRACVSLWLICDSAWERRCRLNVLTWLSCCAAPACGGGVMQVLECEVPIELWKWELSREMGIAPRWFVTFAVLFGAFGVCIHHSFNQNVCVANVSLWLHYVMGEHLFSTCVSVIVYVG